jgi:hypothetical protein
MKIGVLPLLALLAVPAHAEDRWQAGVGLNMVSSDHETYESSNSFTRVQRENKTTPTLFVGYRVLDFANDSNLSVTGEYQFQSRFKTTLSRSGAANQFTTMKTEFFAPGVQWNFQKAVDFGVGLQYRFTSIKGPVYDAAGDFTGGTQSTTYDRPWIHAYVGHTFTDSGPVKPFMALRMATLVGSTSAPKLASDLQNEGGQKRLMRALAPTWEVSLQAGVRF